MAGLCTGPEVALHQVEARIVFNKVAGPYFLMCLEAPQIAKVAVPGQFLMLKANRELEPFLRRPFSIHDADEGRILVLYRVVGRTTTAMKLLPDGESVGLIGPLGNGFSDCAEKNATLIAGGIGIAPMRFLAKGLVSKGVGVTLLAGARTAEDLYVEGFDLVRDTILATDDGSRGRKGLVTEVLEDLLGTIDAATKIYACGPEPMLARVAQLAVDRDIPCELSLEARMACGIGACYGCAVKALDENGSPCYIRVCKEGPVLDAKKLLFNERRFGGRG